MCLRFAMENSDVELQGEARNANIQSLQLDDSHSGNSVHGSVRADATEYSNQTQAILVVVASFALTFVGCGLNFAFGVYQELYESLDGPFEHASPAAIDLIGTLAVSFMTIGAPFASAWTKAFSPRTVSLVGGFILGLSNVLASFGQELWHFLLTQGVLFGIGTCLTYMPAVTTAPGWFDRRRGLALGIILSGTNIGGVVWAPLIRALNASIGFRNTLRATGAAGWILISVAALVLKWDPASERRWRAENQRSSRVGSLVRVPLVNWQVAKGRKFFAHATGAILQGAAYYAPIYFFSSYARTLGYSARAGANFIAVSNATNAVGKVVLGHAADRLGRMNTLALCTVLSAVTALGLWLPSTVIASNSARRTLYITFSITYGMFAGVYVSLFPASLVELFGVQHFASVNGFLYMLRGLGSLVGTPSAGSLIRSSGGAGGAGVYIPNSYERPSILTGVLLAGAGLSVFWARCESVGFRQWKA